MIFSSSRRSFLAAAGALAALSGIARPAFALSEPEAAEFVTQVVQEVEALLRSGEPAEAQAERFRVLFEKRAAVDQIARFVSGAAWRDMSESQQSAFREAFLVYVSRVYASLLSQYEEQTLTVGRSVDAGRKGIVVTSTASGPGLDKPVAVDWVVSDRGGAGAQLIDVSIEGISMLQSQRQEFAAKLEKRGGDVDKLIADMKTG